MNERVCAKVDLGAILYNIDSMFRNLKEGTKMVCVIKTNGYGHGALPIAKVTENDDRIWGYATATAQEAYELREGGIRKPILILGYTFPSDYKEMIRDGIRPAVFKYETALQLSEIAEGLGQKAVIHIALDTGMSRIGYQINEQSADEIARIAALPGIVIEGMFTHFAKADEYDKSFTFGQIGRYDEMAAMLETRGVNIPIKHVSNSAGIMEIPEANKDMVRAGITLYGLYPSNEVDPARLPMRPAMEIKSHVVYIKELEEGRRISYGGTYTVSGSRKIATIPVGYGDGYPRSLSNKGYVLIRGQKAPITGRVCMDQFMVDVTDIKGVCEYDEVTLLGRDGDEVITAELLGDLSGRFNYELVCDITARVPRVYLPAGE